MDERMIARDVNHIQSEIRQLRNQQFTVSTVAITVFGLVTAWLLQRGIGGTTELPAQVALEVVLLTLLFLLFYWGWRLRNLIDILGTYLRLRKWSYWEKDYSYFSKRQHISQMRLQASFFSVLGLLSLAAFLIATIPSHWTQQSAFLLGFTCFISFVYVLLVLGMGALGWFSSPNTTEIAWRQIIESTTPDS